MPIKRAALEWKAKTRGGTWRGDIAEAVRNAYLGVEDSVVCGHAGPMKNDNNGASSQ